MKRFLLAATLAAGMARAGLPLEGLPMADLPLANLPLAGHGTGAKPSPPVGKQAGTAMIRPRALA